MFTPFSFLLIACLFAVSRSNAATDTLKAAAVKIEEVVTPLWEEAKADVIGASHHAIETTKAGVIATSEAVRAAGIKVEEIATPLLEQAEADVIAASNVVIEKTKAGVSAASEFTTGSIKAGVIASSDAVHAAAEKIGEIATPLWEEAKADVIAASGQAMEKTKAGMAAASLFATENAKAGAIASSDAVHAAIEKMEDTVPRLLHEAKDGIAAASEQAFENTKAGVAAASKFAVEMTNEGIAHVQEKTQPFVDAAKHSVQDGLKTMSKNIDAAADSLIGEKK